MTAEPLIDPDCKAEKCSACPGDPCEHHCHKPRCLATYKLAPLGAHDLVLSCDLLAEDDRDGAHHDPRGVWWRPCEDCTIPQELGASLTERYGDDE